MLKWIEDIEEKIEEVQAVRDTDVGKGGKIGK